MQETNQDSSKNKRKSYKKEYEKVAAESAQFKEQLLRTAAEFDNYRKRSLAEKAESFDFAQAEFAKELLSVLDDLDRVVSAGDEHKDLQALQDGLKLVQKHFVKILTDKGLQKMQTIGQPFDPEKHDALMQMEKEGVEPDMVLDEHASGYEWKDKVLRHAKVIVSK